MVERLRVIRKLAGRDQQAGKLHDGMVCETAAAAVIVAVAIIVVVVSLADAEDFRRNIVEGETWAGRGARPRWLVAAIKGGKKLDDFLIDKSAPKRRRKRRSKR